VIELRDLELPTVNVYEQVRDEVHREMADALWNKMLGNPRQEPRFRGIARYGGEHLVFAASPSHTCTAACELLGCTGARARASHADHAEIEAVIRAHNWRAFLADDDYHCPAGARSGAT
jgi:hypothetical protein